MKLPAKMAKEIDCILDFNKQKIQPLNDIISAANRNPTIESMKKVSESINEILEYVKNSFGLDYKEGFSLKSIRKNKKSNVYIDNHYTRIIDNKGNWFVAEDDNKELKIINIINRLLGAEYDRDFKKSYGKILVKIINNLNKTLQFNKETIKKSIDNL